MNQPCSSLVLVEQKHIGLFFLDCGHQSMDNLMKHKVQERDGAFFCMLCRKKLKHFYNMQRHMREVHLSSDGDYHCPPCDRYFKANRSFCVHIAKYHKSDNAPFFAFCKYVKMSKS